MKKQAGICILILFTLMSCSTHQKNVSAPINLTSLKEDNCIPENYRKVLSVLPQNIDLNNLPWYIPNFLIKWEVCRDEYLNKTLPSQEQTTCKQKTYDDLVSLYQQLNTFCQS